MASTSFSSSMVSQEEHQVKKYDVFVSFRGEDIRYGFLSHLSAALHRKKIITFIDDKLEKGEMISESLFKAIQDSKLSIIIFSENFASSTWCLQEVVEIIRCREKMGQMVVPVFYHVDPSHVRKQSGNFGDAFAGHEEKHEKEKVEKWRSTLTKAGSISGWHQTSATSSENELVEDIVGAVLKKLNQKSSSNIESLIGMDSHIKQIESLLCVGKTDVYLRTVGIWGMGGIGKTTVAEAIFHRISGQFEDCCFLANVREEWEKYGRAHLQVKLLSAVLGDKNMNTVSSIMRCNTFLRNRLHRSNVFIVLDDVDTVEQLESLVGESNFFGLGSRIIITTRNKQVLQLRVDKIYEITKLSGPDALRLFSRYAFKRNHPIEGFEELSSMIVKYANGNPLALKVIGVALFCKSKKVWESALNKLEKSPLDEIQGKLRISYDTLGNEEKSIFLDIACFFKGDNKDDVIRILDGCGFHTQFGLTTLVDKCLIYFNDNEIWMHDLVQQMGRAIVLDESQQPGKRTRLWIPKEACDVLRKNKGTEVVEGIILDLSGLNDVHFLAKTFEMMEKLRVLKIYDSKHNWLLSEKVCKVYLPQGLEFLPEELRCLWWHTYPLKSLPSNFDLENLVDLDLRYSDIEEPWNGVQDFSNLKFLNLSHCRRLVKTPDVSRAQNLTRINFEECTGLIDVHPSIWALEKLAELSLLNCKEVRSFPESIHLKSLKTLRLCGCSNLVKFPEILEKMECLQRLYLGITAIEEIPSSIVNLTGLEFLSLMSCKRLKSLPRNIGNLKSLRFLSLNGCSELESLPSSFCQLNSLSSLNLFNCTKLGSLEEISSSIYNLTSLLCLMLPTRFSILQRLPRQLGHLISLQKLYLWGSDIVNIPPCIKQLSYLRYLSLQKCHRLRSLPELPPSIETVCADSCTQLKTVTFPSELFVNTWWTKRVWPYNRIFAFPNCLELDQEQHMNIQEEAIRLIKLIATPSLEFQHHVYKKNYKASPSFYPLLSVLLPEGEFLEWFSNQTMGPSVTVQLPPDCFKCSFMEFAVCALLECKDAIFKNDDYIDCKCTFNNEFGNRNFGFCLYPSFRPEGVLLMLDQVFLGYGALVMDKWPNKCYPTEASFQFSISRRVKQKIYRGDCKVKKCGVRLITPQDKNDNNPIVME